MEKYAMILDRIGIVWFLINFSICLVTIKRIKQNRYLLIASILLMIVQFIGYMEGNFLLMDDWNPNGINKRIYIGNSIMIIAFIVQIVISLKLFLNIKNGKENLDEERKSSQD